jgi:CRP-like cAMP-binding protein
VHSFEPPPSQIHQAVRWRLIEFCLQVLRSIKLCAGVSRLAIKMLAMNVKEEKIAPNKIIVEQGTAPTAIFVIRRGFVRVVRRVRKHRDMFGSVHRSVNPKDAGGEAGGGKDEGRMFECGLLGPTQFFGAISVLELGKMNSMPAYLVSCRTMDVYTLSRLDVGKVSYDDREIMLANAKRQENMIVKDDHEILADYKTGQKWEGFREEIMGQVVISKQVKRKVRFDYAPLLSQGSHLIKSMPALPHRLLRFREYFLRLRLRSYHCAS